MDEKFKIVVTGCGCMANEWVRYAAARKDTEIVALVDIKEENAKDMAKRHNLNCGIYGNTRDAIKNTKANLVFDITIPAAHKEITIAAIKAGCNVLGEKPMAVSMKEANTMVQAVKKSGRMYAVMQNRRYLSNIRAFRELIASGGIGKPGFMCADFFIGPHFGGFREIMDSPLLLDMAIHTFDAARFIMAADPVFVYCHEFNPAGSWYQGNTAAVCMFEFSNGSVFCYRGSWCAEGVQTSWEASWRVTGAKETAVWDGTSSPFAEVVSDKKDRGFIRKFKKIEPSSKWQGREGHFGCLDEMFSALMAGKKAETDCTDNIKSVSMVFGALESAKKGRKVKLQSISN